MYDFEKYESIIKERLSEYRNSIIRQRFTKKFGAYFAEPAFSADNAAGTAYLTYLREQKNA